MSKEKWEERSKKLDQTAKKLDKAGKTMEHVGKILIYLFTIPIIFLVIFGFKGLIVGLIIGVIGIGKTNEKAKQEEREQLKEDYIKSQMNDKGTQ